MGTSHTAIEVARSLEGHITSHCAPITFLLPGFFSFSFCLLYTPGVTAAATDQTGINFPPLAAAFIPKLIKSNRYPYILTKLYMCQNYLQPPFHLKAKQHGQPIKVPSISFCENLCNLDANTTILWKKNPQKTKSF